MAHNTQMETLDNLLESIAFENFTTNIHLAELVNSEAGILKSNNNNINNKTDTLNRYFDNLINFNREMEKANARKSESSSDSSTPDHQTHNGRMPYHQQVNSSIINSFHCQCHRIIIMWQLRAKKISHSNYFRCYFDSCMKC
jgi:hypothetical protein